MEDPYLGEAGISLDGEVTELKRFIKERRAYMLRNLGSWNGGESEM
ncbi:MAG: hypothetical protein HF312_00005 [Ignavibacteria bacterium]|jgi:hypothetical protein|nr:hypothetical protein [Ignavibacteria bacterium]MCU7505262.1 hypothetical protein [Ignavibacteria bacterium]MCU7518564.1 hypothetical protein [Ignavibacteria bacterium]